MTAEQLLSEANRLRFVAYREDDPRAHVLADAAMTRMQVSVIVDRAILRAIEAQDRAMWRLGELESVGDGVSIEADRLRATISSIDEMLRELGV